MTSEISRKVDRPKPLAKSKRQISAVLLHVFKNSCEPCNFHACRKILAYLIDCRQTLRQQMIQTTKDYTKTFKILQEQPKITKNLQVTRQNNVQSNSDKKKHG